MSMSSFNPYYAFLQMYKCLIIPFSIHQIFMLELSPSSTQSTHGAPMLYVLQVLWLDDNWAKLNKSEASRLWNGGFQDELHVEL